MVLLSRFLAVSFICNSITVSSSFQIVSPTVRQKMAAVLKFGASLSETEFD